jgi:hypothetical protein
MCNSKLMRLSGPLLSSVLLLHYFNRTVPKKGEEGRQAPEPQPDAGGTGEAMIEQNPCPEKRKKGKGRQAPEPSRNQEEHGRTSKS